MARPTVVTVVEVFRDDRRGIGRPFRHGMRGGGWWAVPVRGSPVIIGGLTPYPSFFRDPECGDDTREVTATASGHTG